MMHSDTLIALYPGERGSGKTTLLMEQVFHCAEEGQKVLVVSATKHLDREVKRAAYVWDTEPHSLVHFTTESMLEHTRGLQPNHIFVDNADLFEESPVEYINHCHPGTPITLTYTPDTRPAHSTTVLNEDVDGYSEEDLENVMLWLWILTKLDEREDGG